MPPEPCQLALCVPHSRSEDVGLALSALTAVLEEARFRSVRIAYESPFSTSSSNGADPRGEA
jgi:hypothetical protein